MDLQPAPSKVQKGWDAKDSQGRTYQIKSRLVRDLNQNTSFDLATIEEPLDYLVCVFLSPTPELLGVARVPYAVVREPGHQMAKSFRFRWSKRTASDPRIEKLIWSQEV